MTDRTALLSLLTATVLQALDLTIAAIALPPIEAAMGVGTEAGTWVLTSYIVAMALTTPLAGVLSTRVGRRDALLAAIGGLTVASCACALATDLAALLAARIAQGAAAGLIMPLVQATLLDTSRPADHGRAMSYFGAAAMVGPVIGPSIGGLLVDHLGWRAIFWINLPLGLASLAGAARSLHSLPRPRESRLDVTGFTVFGGGVAAAQLFLDRGGLLGWFRSREAVAYAVMALVGIGWTVMRACWRHSAFPRVALFRNRNFAATTSCSFLAGFIVVGTIFLVPAMTHRVFGQDATASGFVLAPRGLGTMAMMLAIARIVGRVDHRVLLAGGVALTAIALSGFALLPGNASLLRIATLSLVQGIGVGLIFTPLSTAAFSFLPAGRRPDAAGLYSLLRNLGCGAGASIMATLLWAPTELAAYRFDFAVLLFVALLMGAISLFVQTADRGPSAASAEAVMDPSGPAPAGSGEPIG